jgi:multimeric flavodoxin WrbA
MIEMLREPLTRSGFDLEVIELCDHQIDFCTGCGVCMDKGNCWIPDDHLSVVKRLLAAEGIVLASPVYFLHVTAQMKTFIDRSLAYGHKPRTSWKPGLAISVSAGKGETQTAGYLADMLRPYGAFSVGTLTAMAVSPGEFVGRKEVALRAEDLANDLVRAIRENRRYPASDKDLGFYQFMSGLVRRNKDGAMKDDYEHWQQNGLFDNFEGYIRQKTAAARFEPELRRAWVKEVIARYKAEKKADIHPSADALSGGAARAST